MTIRILLIDTCTVLRHGLRLILEEDPNLCIVAEAANRSDALTLIQQLTPTVIILDPEHMEHCKPDLFGEIQAASPCSNTIILTNTNHCTHILQAFRSGVKGYLHKSVTSEELIDTIYRVTAGDYILPAKLTSHLISGLATPEPEPPLLTNRELDVLAQVTQGLGNKEIATVLNISQNTVKTHMKRILAKLNLRSRTEAAAYALNNGLVTITEN